MQTLTLYRFSLFLLFIMPPHQERVETILLDYLKSKPSVHLISAKRIYRNLTGDEIELSQWGQAVDEFQELEWDGERVRELAELSKQVAQGGETRRSETYFNIADPTDITVDYIEDEFSRQSYDPSASGPERDGFKWDAENGRVDGQYIYTDVDTELSFNGDVQNLESDGFIEFRVQPEQNLVILESTSVVDVQKTKGYFGRKTNMEISVCGPLTSYPDDAVEMVNDFLDTFEDGRPDPNSDEPGLLQIDEVRMHYPHSDNNDESLEGIEFKGDDIGGHPDVSDRISNGWIIKGFSAPIEFKNDQFILTVAGTGTMAYAKVEGSSLDQRKASDLLEIVRDRYMNTLRRFSP